MARAAEGSLRDALSLLEQARAYCGTNITDAQVRELLGVVPEEILDELTGAIEERSAERVLTLVHRLLAEGQNLQHFCREAIGHFRNLLVARVCGADSELIAAPADERPRLKQAAEFFSEEDLTRFFQILLHTDDDLRRKPDARLHLEMGLLRMVNAARLAPLEEILAELEGGAPATAPRRRDPQAPRRKRRHRARASAPAAFAAATSQGAAAATAPARVQAAPAPRSENTAPPLPRVKTQILRRKNRRGARSRRAAERDRAVRGRGRRARGSASGFHQERDSRAGKISGRTGGTRVALGDERRRSAIIFPDREPRARGDVAGARSHGTFAQHCQPHPRPDGARLC